MHLKKKFKNSSAQWINRQINDQFMRNAKHDGYRARSAYKLIEIDKKFQLFKKAKNIVDLGSAPGSWSQVTRARCPESTNIYAFDLQEMQPIYGVQFLQMNCFDITEESLMQITNNQKVDLIISDMAPPACGNVAASHCRIVELCLQVLALSNRIMLKGGNVVFKVSHGTEEQHLLSESKKQFEKVSFFKPQASRKNSGEIYLVLQNKI